MASLARNSSTFETVRLKAHTVKPWSFMFKTRLEPITDRPISPMSALIFGGASVCGGWDASADFAHGQRIGGENAGRLPRRSRARPKAF